MFNIVFLNTELFFILKQSLSKSDLAANLNLVLRSIEGFSQLKVIIWSRHNGTSDYRATRAMIGRSFRHRPLTLFRTEADIFEI